MFDCIVLPAPRASDLSSIAPVSKGVRLQINGQNLADRDYMTCRSGYCYFGPRRTIIGSVSYRF